MISSNKIRYVLLKEYILCQLMHRQALYVPPFPKVQLQKQQPWHKYTFYNEQLIENIDIDFTGKANITKTTGIHNKHLPTHTHIHNTYEHKHKIENAIVRHNVWRTGLGRQNCPIGETIRIPHPFQMFNMCGRQRDIIILVSADCASTPQSTQTKWKPQNFVLFKVRAIR